MKKAFLVFSILFFVKTVSFAQVSGNQLYNPNTQPTPYRTSASFLTGTESNNSETVQVYYLESSVLMNLKADEYNAVFGIAQEGKTAQESEQKVDALIGQLTGALNSLGIAGADIYVDFITQNPVYEYDAQGKTAKENLVGYQTKKNVSIRYKTESVLRQITNAANRAGIYDLIKVDYVVGNQQNIKLQLMEEAIKIIKRKEEMGNLLGIKLKPVAIVQENFQVFTPNELYRTYQAYETGETSGYKKVVEKRKPTTSYYQALNPNDFDMSLNPIGLEPIVQCTLYLRVKYLPPATILRSEIMPTPSPTPK
jgi:uncharacterized protein YggE